MLLFVQQTRFPKTHDTKFHSSMNIAVMFYKHASSLAQTKISAQLLDIVVLSYWVRYHADISS